MKRCGALLALLLLLTALPVRAGEAARLVEAMFQAAALQREARPWLLAALGREPEIREEDPAPEEARALYEAGLQRAWSLLVRGSAGEAFRALLGEEDALQALAVMGQAVRDWAGEIDHEKLLGINRHYACWLYSPGTPIDYPVVLGPDNRHWLHRLFDGAWNFSGTLFIDCRNLPGFLDPNTLIYGHNMRNNSMFGTLTDYGVEGYYQAHPYLLVLAPRAMYLLEPVAAYVTGDGDPCYEIALSDDEDMLAFVEQAVNKSDFDSGVAVAPGDRLVTLSTCAYAFQDARYVVIGRLEPIYELYEAADPAPAGDAPDAVGGLDQLLDPGEQEDVLDGPARQGA